MFRLLSLCCREMAASFDLAENDGRDRFPNLDQACQHVIECIQVGFVLCNNKCVHFHDTSINQSMHTSLSELRHLVLYCNAQTWMTLRKAHK